MTIPILTRIVAGGPAAGVDFNLVASIEARAPADTDKVLGREQIFLDTSATPHALHYHSGVAANAWEQIGGAGGATVTSGTADPTGGAGGDQYLQVNASNVVESIWLNVSGTWSEFTLPSGSTLSDDDPEDVGSVASEGTGTEASRDDHVHVGVQLSDADPEDVSSAADGGSAADASRSDHVHIGGTGGGGTPQALSRFEAVTTANTTAQALAAAYADILEIAATDVFANVGAFTYATVSNITTITIPNDGLFKVTAHLKVVTGGSARSQVYLRANVLRSGVVLANSATIMGGTYVRAISGAASGIVSGTTTLLLETGDTITFQMAEESNTGNTYTIGGADSVVEIVEIPSEVRGVVGATGAAGPNGTDGSRTGGGRDGRMARMARMVQPGRNRGLDGTDGCGVLAPDGMDGADGAGAAPVQEEGTQVTATPTALNFVGDGVTATDVAGVATITIPGGGGGGGTHTEQRVLNEQPDDADADTLGKFIIEPGGNAYTTHQETVQGVPATGDFAVFSHANYIGELTGDPNPLSVPLGTYYFLTVDHRLRVTAINALNQQRWTNASWSDLLVTGGAYRGSHASDAIALFHVQQDGDVYYLPSSAAIRVVSNFVAGSNTHFEYEPQRLAFASESSRHPG